MRSGKLTIVCFEAELTRDTELLGKMSPYLEVTVGGLTLQTEKHKEAGKVPNWKGEELNFQLRDVTDFHYKVMDYEPTGNHDLVGSHTIEVRKIPQGRHVKKMPIYYESTQVGQVKLGFKFQPTAEGPAVSQPQVEENAPIEEGGLEERPKIQIDNEGTTYLGQWIFGTEIRQGMGI